jgi:hypothetical protein
MAQYTLWAAMGQQQTFGPPSERTKKVIHYRYKSWHLIGWIGRW